MQQNLYQYFDQDSHLTDNETESLKNPIEPTGDPLIEKQDGKIRFAFHNINGLSIKEGHKILLEVASIHALQLDFVRIRNSVTRKQFIVLLNI